MDEHAVSSKAQRGHGITRLRLRFQTCAPAQVNKASKNRPDVPAWFPPSDDAGA
jgi:hypothetical protein